MTRGINLSTSSPSRTTRRSSRTTGNNKEAGLQHNNNNGSINAFYSNNGRTIDDEGEEERLVKKHGDSLVGGTSARQRRRSPRHSIKSISLTQDEEAEMMNSNSKSRAARYNARSARKSDIHRLPTNCVLQDVDGESADGTLSDLESLDEIAASVILPRSKRRNYLFFNTSYSTLFTITIALLAWSMIQPTQAALSCTTDADCSSKGSAKCKADRTTGASTCVYKSCSAGFWGAGNTYSDCFECPKGMTSLDGKAFYETDCFLPCGNARCYIPEDGSTECSFEAATAKHMCYSTCNDASFTVINANKPYATCVRKTQVQISSNSTSLTNQAAGSNNKRKVVKLFNNNIKRGENNAGGGRRLKLKKDVDLRHQGPAVALLRDAGRDPLALVSK